jgi:hypothetical protein
MAINIISVSLFSQQLSYLSKKKKDEEGEKGMQSMMLINCPIMTCDK